MIALKLSFQSSCMTVDMHGEKKIRNLYAELTCKRLFLHVHNIIIFTLCKGIIIQPQGHAPKPAVLEQSSSWQ